MSKTEPVAEFNHAFLSVQPGTPVRLVHRDDPPFPEFVTAQSTPDINVKKD